MISLLAFTFLAIDYKYGSGDYAEWSATFQRVLLALDIQVGVIGAVLILVK